MDQTAPPPPPPPQVDDGPRVTAAQLRDMRRLRRVHDGRTLGGVCGGLGRHFDVDPTIVRVVLVALVFFGGAGLFLYLALWLLIPDEATGRAVLDVGEDAGKVLIVVAAGVAALLVLGHGWSGWWRGPGLPIGIVVLLGVLYLVGRDRRQRPATPTMTPTADPTPPATASVPAYTAAYTSAYTSGAYASAYVPPPRPRRSGPVLLWPTIAVVAIALGCLGVYDAGHHVATGAYWALALAVIGAALVLGAFKGRPGGLVLAGLLTTAGLVGSLVAGGVRSAQQLDYDPPHAADVASSYRIHTGELSLNLSDLDDPAGLDGRTVRLRGDVGDIEVVVPRDVTVVVDTRVRTAGAIQIADLYDHGALGGSSAGYTLRGPTGSPTMTLDADLRVGQIEVRYPR